MTKLDNFTVNRNSLLDEVSNKKLVDHELIINTLPRLKHKQTLEN